VSCGWRYEKLLMCRSVPWCRLASETAVGCGKGVNWQDVTDPWNSFPARIAALLSMHAAENWQAGTSCVVRRDRYRVQRPSGSRCNLHEHWASNWANAIPFPQAVCFILATLLILKAVVSRFHDIGWSGWAVLLMFVPLVDILALILLLVMPGQKQPNAYGEPPIFLGRLRSSVDN
jgi:uncharacterized membrane protein YhaH (DUF805 family)